MFIMVEPEILDNMRNKKNYMRQESQKNVPLELEAELSADTS